MGIRRKKLVNKELLAIENTFVTPDYVRRIVTIVYLNADFGNVYVNLLTMKELVRELRGIFSYAQPQLTRACFHLASILHKLEIISESQINRTMAELLPFEEELIKMISRTREIAMVGEDYERYCFQIVKMMRKMQKIYKTNSNDQLSK